MAINFQRPRMVPQATEFRQAPFSARPATRLSDVESFGQGLSSVTAALQGFKEQDKQKKMIEAVKASVREDGTIDQPGLARRLAPIDPERADRIMQEHRAGLKAMEKEQEAKRLAAIEEQRKGVEFAEGRQKFAGDQSMQQEDIRAKQVKNAVDGMKAVAQALMGATPETWGQVRAQVGAISPKAAEMMPDAFDPEWVKSAVAQGQTKVEAIELQLKQQEADTRQRVGQSAVDLNRARAANFARMAKGGAAGSKDKPPSGPAAVMDKDTFKRAESIRREFNSQPAVRALNDAKSGIGALRGALEDAKGGNMQAVRPALMKALRFFSNEAIMQADIEGIAETGDLRTRLQAAADQMTGKGGGSLGLAGVENLAQTAEAVYSKIEDAANSVGRNYAALAERSGVDPSLVILSEETAKDPKVRESERLQKEVMAQTEAKRHLSIGDIQAVAAKRGMSVEDAIADAESRGYVVGE